MFKPRKRFAQHFLRDPVVIQHLVDTIAPTSAQHLVEIGPGEGALTLPLLKRCKTLEVIEIDHDLGHRLAPLSARYPSFRVYQADALHFDFSQLKKTQPIRIVGNLPYNISTPLLFWLLNYTEVIEDMLFMLQKEVVERLSALPATPDYGRLSVMIQQRCQVEKLFDVSATAFYPRPQVTSSVVRLVPHAVPPIQVLNSQHFAQIVQAAFKQRRKMLRNTLKDWLAEDVLQRLGVDPCRRAETLTLEEFSVLANSYTCHLTNP